MALSEPTDPSPITAVREQALDALAPDADAQTVVGTTLQALYRHHPDVRLDDVLELANHIDLKSADATASQARTLDTQIQQVLDQALIHLSEWKCPEQRPEQRPAPVNGNTLITENDEPTV